MNILTPKTKKNCLATTNMLYKYSNNGLDYNTNNNLHISATNYKQKTAKNIQHFIMTTKIPPPTPPSILATTTTTKVKSHKLNKHFVVLYPKVKISTSSLTSSSLSSKTSLSAYTTYSSSSSNTTTDDTIRDFVVVDHSNSNTNNNNNNHTTTANNNNNDNNSNNSNSNNIAYVSNLLKRIKRLAQPRILRVKSSHAGGMGSGYNRRNKEFRFGKCLL